MAAYAADAEGAHKWLSPEHGMRPGKHTSHPHRAPPGMQRTTSVSHAVPQECEQVLPAAAVGTRGFGFFKLIPPRTAPAGGCRRRTRGVVGEGRDCDGGGWGEGEENALRADGHQISLYPGESDEM